MSEPLTGGCQCGAVRFRVDGEVRHLSVCHCRMCQKASGALFGVVGSVRVAELTWTRGELSYFRSSSLARRGFCRDCGTPLTYQFDGARHVAISLGAYDDPNQFEEIEFALEVSNAHPVTGRIMEIPENPMTSTPEDAEAFANMKTFQHPDHDTQTWPEPK